MSRLTDLLMQVERSDPALAADLRAEVKALSNRRHFGLNFERHQPESVELPERAIRRGDKVRILPPRGSTERGDQRLWSVLRVVDDTAHLVEIAASAEPERASRPVEDLIAVAEFRDRIYPGLVSTGRVERGDTGQPFHTVINAENFHALEALLYTHEGSVDAIYIDPPYNTGARDWKYNNDYVDDNDDYRHSKWLAMMERRLQLAKRLLNPDDSVLIVTIDEKEIHRLGLLLEQHLPTSAQLVSVVIAPLGQKRGSQLARVEEYAFYVCFGAARLSSVADDLLNPLREVSGTTPVRWERLIRGGGDATRQRNPDLFYPVMIDPQARSIITVDEPIPPDCDRRTVTAPAGLVAVWPLRQDGSEGRWRCSPTYLRDLVSRGYARVGEYDRRRDQWTISYLGRAQIRRVDTGEIETLGRGPGGEVILGTSANIAPRLSAKTIWNRPAHRAGEYGTGLNRQLLPGRVFPYPKSLYAVEDALRLAVADKPEAFVLDFFAGSGTTAHAVMRLNKQDGGRRQCISVTNNEVGADEQQRLRTDGLRPGDPKWEQHGICDHITKPRIEAAITGQTPDGEPIKGDYKFTDEFPMADGFAENAEFFTLTYEAPRSVAHGKAFERIAPLLWLRAGARGRRIEQPTETYDVAETYGVLFNVDASADFVAALGDGVRIAFVVSDDERAFQLVCGELPDHVEPVRLYESYLTLFQHLGAES